MKTSESPSRSGLSDKRTSNLVLVLGVVLLAPLLYLGSYLALLDDGGPVTATFAGSDFYRVPNFKVGGVAAQYAYWPAYLLDRTVRPRRWRLDIRDSRAVEDDMWIPALGW